MNDIAIRVEGLGKSYRLGKSAGGGAPYRTLRDEVMQIPARLRGALGAGRASAFEEFWALRDVSFEVKRGEVLGVIGRNGAGKSTLLKILSRIVEPTAGEVDLYGRVGSLLEVGTGFHPELTGRENIYLSGAILGMRRHEVRARLDEIVAFAGVERFVDQPVKNFSSGMYARLAFAVAAHLETEILIVDEVLAVGDAEFQKRCMGKMGSLAAKTGTTVLFVSHNLSAMRQLCTQALWLEQGRQKDWGMPGVVLSDYLRAYKESGTRVVSDVGRRDGLFFREARLLDSSGQPTVAYSLGDNLVLEFYISRDIGWLSREVCLAVTLRSVDGIPLAHMVDADSGFRFSPESPGQWVRMTLQDQRFYPGDYELNLWASSPDGHEVYASWPSALSFSVLGGGTLTRRSLPLSSGLIFLTPSWEQRP